MNPIFQLCRFLLITLWVYAGASKLLDYQQTRFEMARQIFDASFADILSWLIPATEVTVALLLLIPLFTRYGLYLSGAMLFVFTIYVVGGVMHWYESVPCSPGGVIRYMTWGQHLLFNLAFLSANITAIIVEPERKEVTPS